MSVPTGDAAGGGGETTAAPEALLRLDSVEVVYDHVISVLRGVSIAVPEGAIVALLGPNGAGKTTTLKAISNLLRVERGDITGGEIHFRGRAHRPARAGRPRAPRHHPGHGGEALLPPPHGSRNTC